ncbi:MAG: TlpA family protein disulfide reductase [Planctomycetota bacterium]|jgi:hypothetical protein
MRRSGEQVLTVVLSFALSAPALAQESRPGQGPPPGAATAPLSLQVDPEQDEVLQTIRAAVSPSADQMEQLVELYTSLRQQQRRILTEMTRGMRRARDRGNKPEGSRQGRRPDREELRSARMHAMAQLKALERKFLEGGRALLAPGQFEAWDDCAATLDLMPAVPGARRGRSQGGPDVGDEAPAFELRDLEGNTVSLASLRGKPVVLEFGSYTCPVFRRRVEKIEQLRRRFGDAVNWVLVYTKEAQPIDGRISPANTREGIEIPQHTSFEKRVECARLCTQKTNLGLRVLVDDLDDRVTEAYRGHPNRGYVIDGEGRVVSRQAWFDPARTRTALKKLLAPVPPPPDNEGA